MFLSVIIYHFIYILFKMKFNILLYEKEKEQKKTNYKRNSVLKERRE
jgi:hypothetical protein